MVGFTQNNVNLNTSDFYENAGSFDINNATVNSVSSDAGAATPSAHVLTIAGANGVTTSGAGSTITVDGSGLGGSGDWVLVSSATAADSATIDFTGLSASYFIYVVDIQGLIPETDDTTLYIRTSTDGGSSYDSGTTDYGWCNFYEVSGSSKAVSQDNDNDHAEVMSGLGNVSSTDDFSTKVYISNPSSATWCFLYHNSGIKKYSGAIGIAYGSGARRATADVDAIRFYMSSGNIASGNFRLYGVVGA